MHTRINQGKKCQGQNPGRYQTQSSSLSSPQGVGQHDFPALNYNDIRGGLPMRGAYSSLGVESFSGGVPSHKHGYRLCGWSQSPDPQEITLISHDPKSLTSNHLFLYGWPKAKQNRTLLSDAIFQGQEMTSQQPRVKVRLSFGQVKLFSIQMSNRFKIFTSVAGSWIFVGLRSRLLVCMCLTMASRIPAISCSLGVDSMMSSTVPQWDVLQNIQTMKGSFDLYCPSW